ncbi:MAG: hypothetical protein MJE66_16170 [Proteobacteria bacterium]|nr:hypothetical protein [Pseudomonadota bacterium]
MAPASSAKHAHVGSWRRPRNDAADQKGGIHDDETAGALGFRGGTVAGSIHMEQFPPLLIEAFGPGWLETGSLSLYFLYATRDNEPVRCRLERAEAAPRADVWIETEDGRRVCEGTASVGAPDLDSALCQRLKGVRPPGELRDLGHLKAGDTCAPVPVRIRGDHVEHRLGYITEPLAAYRATADPRVAPPVHVVQALCAVEEPLLKPPPDRGVGLFGAIEIQYLAGPVVVDRDYEVRGRVLALSDSPKTEIVWYESVLAEPTGGRDVARMIMMSRLLKASSPRWTPGAVGAPPLRGR